MKPCNRLSFCFAVSLLLPFLAQGSGLTDENLLFRAGFDGSFEADFASGSGTPFVPERLLRAGAPGVLKLPPNQMLCYPAPGNIDLEAGTLVIRVRPGFTPGEGVLPKELTEVYLFSLRNRYGHRLDATINEKTGGLYVHAARGKTPTTSVKVDVRGWKKGEWRTVTVAWERPGRLSAAVEGLPPVAVKNARLPECPAEFLYDIYIGSNSQGLPVQQYGKLGTFPGEIDEVRIYRGFASQAPGVLPESRKRSVLPAWPDGIAKQPEWVGRNRRRISFALGETKKQWKNTPVRFRLDLSKELGRLDLAARRAAVASMRLVACDPATGKPLARDVKLSGEERYFQPFQLDDDFLNRMSGELGFVHTGKLPALYSLYFDAESPYAAPAPAEYPLPGFGMPLMLGKKNRPGIFGGAFRGAFDAVDFDGDGDLDLFFIAGWQTDSGRDLFGGLYYYENLRNRTGYDLFAAPVLIDKGNLEFGRFAQTAPPRLADIDGDGKMECVFISGYLAASAEIVRENGCPKLTGWKPLKFDGKTPKLISSAVLHDFDGDGLPDIFSDGRLHRNIGTKQEPLFRSEGEDLFVAGVRGPQGKILTPGGGDMHTLAWAVADVDGDGRFDLVCGGVSSLLYYFPGRADGRFDRPRQLLTHDGHEIDFPGVFPYPLFRDVDGDGALDLMLGSEDGTLGVCFNRARPGEAMLLMPPVFLQEERAHLNAGTLAIPVAADWNGDGLVDILSGSANGRVYYWENIGTPELPVYRTPVELAAGGRPIILRAGPDGSVQGEGESDWGYTNIEVADWDMDGLKDLIVTGVRGEHVFFRNIGEPGEPRLAPGTLIEVDFPGETPVPPGFRFRPRGRELLTVTRCRPSVFDWNGDGLVDYIVTDHTDRLAFYERFRRADGSLGLKPGRHVFELNAPFFRSLVWNHETLGGLKPRPGGMGRSVTQIVDWNGDGRPDLLMDNINARLFLNSSDTPARAVMTDCGDLAPQRLANHNTAPYAADLDGDGIPDLIVGTENGWIYGYLRAYLEKDMPVVSVGPVEGKAR